MQYTTISDKMMSNAKDWENMTAADQAQHPSIPNPGIPGDFERQVDPYLRELLVHCYRFLGSMEDAEDALQEALLRAWRARETLRSPDALRPWLYRIATRACLDLLETRRSRSMPPSTHPPATPGEPLPAPVLDPIWIGPLPDEYLDSASPTPEARFELRESVSLAFLTILQQLPGRQRAALLLQDVLGWKAAETAETLGISVAAVNSALQRARSTVRERRPAGGFTPRATAGDPQTADLLSRYVKAWENADLPGLVSLLRNDVILSMPPVPAWYLGREAVREFFGAVLFSAPLQGRFRLLAIRANGSPAFAVYQRDGAGVFRAAALQVIRIDGSQVAQIDDFLVLDEHLFQQFNLPNTIDR